MKMRLEKRALDKLFRRRDRIEIPEFQRGEVWSTEKKQVFMDTILKGWFVPVAFLRVVDEQNFECIDGQQRLNAIFGFYNNEYPLPRKHSGKYGGNFYKNLPDRIQDIFDDYELHIVEIEDPKDGEVEELFQRLQLGVPLNSGEKLNAMRGDIRDFAVEISHHNFVEKKTSLKNYRFAFLSICSQICLFELEGISDAKFKNLQSFYRKHGVFNKKSSKANKIRKAFNFLNRSFNSRASELSNRASVVSLYLLVSDLLDKTSLEGKEKSINKFYIDFLRKLRAEVQKGALARDVELILYQSAVNQAADSKESIQRRHDILMKRLADFDSDFEQFMEKDAVNDRLLALENEREMRTLSNDIFGLLSDCNSVCSSKSKKEIFQITSKAFRRISDIDKLVTTKDEFGNFIDALYEMVYEGSGSLKRIPSSFKKNGFIGFTVKIVRTDLRHDLEHGDEKEIKKKRARLSEIYKQYAGKTSFSSLENKDLFVIQRKILQDVKSFLTALKKWCGTL